MCVKRIPTEINHVNRVLDGGQGSVREPARLSALTMGQESSSSDKLPKLLKLQEDFHNHLTSKMAIWPPEMESGTAIRWQLTQKPSHSPGVVRLRLCRFVMCVSRCITAPWMWRNLDVGPEWQKTLDEPLLITEEWRWVWWVRSYPAGCGQPCCSGLDWGGSLRRDLRWMKESGRGQHCCWGYSEDCWRSSNHVLHPEVKERNYGTDQVTLQLMATAMCIYLFAPPSGQLLCRRFFCWWCLCFGPLVWVEADFPHLRTIQLHIWTVFKLWLQDKQLSGANLPVYSPPATTPLQTWQELCLLYLGKGLHETPGLNAGRCTCAISNTKGSMNRTSHSQVMDLLSHLARDLVADRNNAAVGQLQHTDHLTGHHVQGHLGYHGDSSCWGVCQRVAHWK